MGIVCKRPFQEKRLIDIFTTEMIYNNIKKRLSTLDGRTLTVAKNSVATAVMKAGVLVCSLIMVPITLDYLDTEKYGVWMAMTSVLYWFAFFDIGLGNGMRNYMAEALSAGDKEKARSYFSTAMFILTGLAIIIAVIIIPLIQVLDINTILNTRSISNKELAIIISMAIFFTLIQFVTKNIGMVYIAMQKYAINDLIIFIGNILSVITVYILTKTTESNLAYVVAVFTGIPALAFLISAIPLLHKHPYLMPKFSSINTDIAKRVVSKGLGFFIIQITSCLIVFGSANVFISHYCGPEQVTIYNICFKLFNLLTVAYTIVLSPLWNAYTDAVVKNDYTWISRTYKRSIQILGISIIAGLLLLSISGFFFEKWVGNSVTIPFEISVCVLLYVCSFNFANCAAYLLNGFNKIKVQIILSIILTIIDLVAITSVTNKYGIIGIILSMATVSIIEGCVYAYQAKLLITKKAYGIWNK